MLKNLFLKNIDDLERYTSKKRGRPFSIPPRNRIEHGTRLLSQLTKIWNENENQNAVSVTKDHGTYVEFISSPNLELKFNSLEYQSKGIKLLNVRERTVGEEVTKFATVFIPKGEENYFSNKVSDYLDENKNTKNNKPKNNDLIASINDIKRALIKSFWSGKDDEIPNEEKRWCEVWISDDNTQSEAEFRNTLLQNNIELKKEVLTFPERKVLLAKLNSSDINLIIEKSNLLAELRIATEASSFFVNLSNAEQAEWVKDLFSRTSYIESSDRVLILDKGINNGHQLIKPLLKDSDRKTYNDSWGVSDNDSHGTGMAGLVAYGNLEEKLQSNEAHDVDFALESYKILPPNGENDRELYGAITLEGISTFYIDNKDYNRIICMAVTEDSENNDGIPSSWSSALDETTSGYIDNIKKLLVVSAGNWHKIDGENLPYPEMNILSSVQSPAQSWNAISVGAYTEKVNFDILKYRDYKIVADNGLISPHSRTSSIWDDKWPIKPEVVFEGGNMLVDSSGNVLETEELDLITTYSKPQDRQFTNFFGTSASSALIANMAMKLQKVYPDAWPETIRGLIIHSAEWTEGMKNQFLKDNAKKSYRRLLRTCGYGVPSFERAVQCKNNFVNLIIQSEIQPFEKGKNNIKTKEMNIHQIPWPKEALEELFDKNVRMKVTLSYFIEPGPGNIGFKNKYKYPSCNLRFEVNGNENKIDFMKRISKTIEEEEETNVESRSSSIKWVIGPNNRNVGSIHSDVWVGTGAALSTSNYIAVYPASGWWKERKSLNSYEKKIRYSLIISLYTEAENIDLYTSIVNKIKVPIEIEIQK